MQPSLHNAPATETCSYKFMLDSVNKFKPQHKPQGHRLLRHAFVMLRSLQHPTVLQYLLTLCYAKEAVDSSQSRKKLQGCVTQVSFYCLDEYIYPIQKSTFLLPK